MSSVWYLWLDRLGGRVKPGHDGGEDGDGHSQPSIKSTVIIAIRGTFGIASNSCPCKKLNDDSTLKMFWKTGKVMRIVSMAAVVSLLLITPVFADDASDLAAAKAAIAAAKISPEADLLTWCGAAFTLLASAEKDDAAKAKIASDNAAALFAKAEPLLTADGVTDLTAMGGDYTTVAAAQLLTETDKPSHTQDECVTAATQK